MIKDYMLSAINDKQEKYKKDREALQEALFNTKDSWSQINMLHQEIVSYREELVKAVNQKCGEGDFEEATNLFANAINSLVDFIGNKPADIAFNVQKLESAISIMSVMEDDCEELKSTLEKGFEKQEEIKKDLLDDKKSKKRRKPGNKPKKIKHVRQTKSVVEKQNSLAKEDQESLDSKENTPSSKEEDTKE